VLRRGFKRGNQSGAVKDRGGISILEDERRVVAGHSRNQCQRGWGEEGADNWGLHGSDMRE
jgi:hypothetical protein